MSNKQHLVVISGADMYRYSGGKRIEHAKVDAQTWENLTIAERKDLIEDFRKNGLPPPEAPADEAFFVAQHEMQTKPPLEGMELAGVLALWNSEIDDSGYLGRYRAEDVWEELHRRGVSVPRG